MIFLSPSSEVTRMYSILVGIDIAKKTFDVSRLENGKYQPNAFANTPEGFHAFLAWLTAYGLASTLCVLEATGLYGLPLMTFLHDQGIPVSQVNPAAIKAFAQSELSRTKSDKADARLIARFGRERQPRLWTPPTPAVHKLQILLRRIEQLMEMRQMELNRLEGAEGDAQASIQQSISRLDQDIKDMQQKVKNTIDQDADLKKRRDLLESIPGIGEATSPYLLILFADPHDFEDPKQAVAFVGLSPNPHQSGASGKTRLSRIGDARLRKALYMPAMVAQQHNPVLKAFSERLKANGKKGKVILCAIMRKLIHIAFGVLKSGRPFDPNFALA